MVRLQDEYESFFCVADLHAITVPAGPGEAAGQTREIAAAYLAAGLDPGAATIFAQSTVPAHAELAWVFNCVARAGLARPDDPVQGQGRQARGAR